MNTSAAGTVPHEDESRLLDDLLRRIAAGHPHAPALGERDRAVDFATLDRRVHRVANGLAASGSAGDRIAIVGRNSAEQVELLLGIVRAGQVALPVNWRLAAPEIRYILSHSGATRVFADREFAAIVAQADDEVARSLRAFALAAGHAFQIRDDFADSGDSAVTGKDTGKDVGKATLINALGSDEAQRRLAQYLRDAERHLADALGPRQGTRRFIASLFQQGRGAIRLVPDPVAARSGADSAACLDARG